MLLVGWMLACTRDPDPVTPEPTTTDSAPTDPDTQEPPRPSNLLFLSIDTTRRDYIDRYATDGVVRSPFLTELLSQSLVLDDHQQCSNWTFASTSCTLEGRLNEDTGWMAKLNPFTRRGVPPNRRTVAARLGEHGYYSILVSSNEWLSETWNNTQGYQESWKERTVSTTELLEKGKLQLGAFWRTHQGPWFLHVHLIQAHPAYNPPDPYDDAAEALPPIPWDIDQQADQYATNALWPQMTPQEQALLKQHLQARYTGEIQLQDDELAAWWADMDAEGWLDDTLVVIWTDHGEQFWEHGHQAHAWDLGAEENDGILAFWSKTMTPQTFTGPTHAIDLLPTVLDMLGIPPDPGEVFDGYVVGTAPPDRPRFAAHAARGAPQVSVTKDGWKLLYALNGPIFLWDRNTDRQEQVNLYAPDHPKVLELWELLLPRAQRVSQLNPEFLVTWPEGLPH